MYEAGRSVHDPRYQHLKDLVFALTDRFSMRHELTQSGRGQEVDQRERVSREEYDALRQGGTVAIWVPLACQCSS